MREKGYLMVRAGMISLLLLLGGCVEEEGEGDQALDSEAAMYDEMEAKPAPGDMVEVPAGEFTMGSDEKAGEPPLAAPAHSVELPTYSIDAYEVTNGDFARFQLESDYQAEGDWRASYTIGKEDFPVANVTWDDAKAYCEWAEKRLPTEAEWEKAARGTEGLTYPWGSEFDPQKANTNEHGTRNLMEVGSLPEDKSPYGAYDMFGNVQEWTSEKLDAYPNSPARGADAFGGRYVSVRGASYAMKGRSMYLWTRSGYLPKSQFGLGFRCVKDAGTEGEMEESADN